MPLKVRPLTKSNYCLTEPMKITLTPRLNLTRTLFLALFVGAIISAANLVPAAFAEDSAKLNTSETPAQHDARMKWWREARFGMFIHWGLYSQAAGEWDGKPDHGAGEWILN